MSKLAALNEFPAGALSQSEWLLFFRLREIYSNYRSGVINKQQGELLKNKAIAQFEDDKKTIDFANKILAENANMWGKINKSAINYAKSPSIETADELYKAIYSVERKNL